MGNAKKQTRRKFESGGIATLPLGSRADVHRFVVHATQLYEQGRKERVKAPLLGVYVRRWRGWARAGKAGIGADCAETLSQSIALALGHIPASSRAAASALSDAAPNKGGRGEGGHEGPVGGFS